MVSGPAMMAHRLGAKVVLADCEPGTYQISVDDADAYVENSLRPRWSCRTRISVAPPAAALSELCYEHDVKLVDDAAHAFPTIDRDTLNMVGSGRDTHATFFSFYATKCITTGEGGMVTTNNAEPDKRGLKNCVCTGQPDDLRRVRERQDRLEITTSPAPAGRPT